MTTQNLIPSNKRNSPNAAGWISGGSSTRTDNFAVAPDGSTTAWKFKDDEGAFAASMWYPLTVTADTARHSAWAFVQKETSPDCTAMVAIIFGNDGSTPLRYSGAEINKQTGALTDMSGYGGGWTACAAKGCIDFGDYWLVYVEQTNNSYAYGYTRLYPALNGNSGGYSVFWTPGTSDGAVHPTLASCDFEADVTYGGAPLPVNYTNLSTGNLTDSWDFGNGSTSTSTNPSTSYTDAGARYTVSLSITTEFQGTLTETKTYYIGVIPTPATFPCIAWNNLFEDPDVTVTVSSEQSGFEKENAYDWRPYTWWKPDDGDQWIKLHRATAMLFNCFAIYGHNLGENGAYVKVQYSFDDTTWYDAMPAVSPAATEVIYRRGIPTSASYIRLFVSSAVASRIACIFIGTDLETERGCRQGFGPPSYNRSTVIQNTVSENGVFLGRTTLRQDAMVQMNFDFLTEDFIREDWLPFVEHAETKPWFLLWDESEHSDEGAWCFTEGQIPGSTFSSATLMTAGMTARARVE